MDVLLAEPGVRLDEDAKCRVDEVRVRLGVGDAFELFDALLVGNPLRLEFRHQFGFLLADLCVEDRPGVFENGLDEGQQFEHIAGRLRIEHRNRINEKR